MLKHSDTATDQELRHIADMVVHPLFLKDSVKRLQTLYTHWRYEKVKGVDLFLGVSRYCEVEFYVNGESCRCDNMPISTGVLIWRWLIRVWPDLVCDLPNGTILTCDVEASDGLLHRRITLFERLGFKLIDRRRMSYDIGS